MLRDVNDRYERYLQSEISEDIYEGDLMYYRAEDIPAAVALNHYLQVGRSAIDAIAGGMVLSGKTQAGAVLDLPSGAGRVTRHLVKFFPEAEVYVSEFEKDCEEFAARFGAQRFEAAEDFATPSARNFDVIFVGSLITHLSEQPYLQALRWFVDALAPDGLLVITVHGRQHDLNERVHKYLLGAEAWAPVAEAWKTSGFGYIETQRLGENSYGYSINRISWLMRHIEEDASIRLISFQEAAWDNHQDVLIVQKKPLAV